MELKPERRPDQCSYYLLQKRRFCRMKAIKVNGYCAEHILKEKDYLIDSTSSDISVRIPCPLDSSHTVYNHLLHKHLKKCNAAKKPVLDCYSKSINCGQVDHIPRDEEKLLPLCDYDPAVIDEVIRKVDRAYQILYEDIQEEYGMHPLLEKEIANDVNGPAACKHLVQQSSIISHLDGLHLLTNDTCFLEFGAGRGALSHWIQQATDQNDSVHYVLIDRASCRRKMDVKHRYESQGPKFERLLIDIRDLELKKLTCTGGYSKMVAVSKHLCGEATDLTLRCLSNYHHDILHHCSPLDHLTSTSYEPPVRPPSLPITTADSTSHEPLISSTLAPTSIGSDISTHNNSVTCRQQRAHLKGIVIALCCHQRCKWKSFFGHEILSGLGFTPMDFHIIAHMSSWAVCGVRPTTDGEQPTTDGVQLITDDVQPTTDEVRPTNEVRPTMDTAINNQLTQADNHLVQCSKDSSNSEHSSTASSSSPIKGYRPHPKENIGLKCKRLLDMCRVKALRQSGYSVRLVYYTHRHVSLENVLLIATT